MELLVTIRDKIATYAEMRPYVCGNSDYVIHFDMDEEWAAHETKTARFVKDDGTYHDQVFTGNDCPVPVISNTFSIRVGVYAGDLHTTTPAYIPAKKSILCGSAFPADPAPDVYAQLMEHLNQIEQNGVSEAEIKAAIAAYLEENPVEGVTPEEVEAAIEKYMQEHPVLVEESDPTVPDWAKQPEKPTYTAQEVGAQPKGDYALKSEIPNVPVQSVNGQTGNVQLDIPPAYELPTASADTLGGVKVGEGLQMTGDALGVKPDKEYELIESITITEDDNGLLEIIRDNFGEITDVIITCFTPAQSVAQNIYTTFYTKAGGLTCGGAAYMKGNMDGRSRFKMRRMSGLWDVESEIGYATSSGEKFGQVGGAVLTTNNNETISRIRIYTFATGFHAGTTFDIWGVRADA